jgi:hypothetical protein
MSKAVLAQVVADDDVNLGPAPRRDTRLEGKAAPARVKRRKGAA